MRRPTLYLIAPLLGVMLLTPAMGKAPSARPGKAAKARSVKGGRLSRLGDFYVLHLKGTWHEMGKAHGQLLAEQVRQSTVNTWQAKIVRRFGKAKAEKIRSMALKSRTHLPKEIQEELRGIAEGSGVALEEIELATLMGGMLVYSANRGAETGQESSLRANCSSFAACGKATRDGKLIYGHNFDFDKSLGVHERPLCVAYEPEDGQRFCTLGWAGILVAITGLNEAKISLGCIGASSVAEQPEGLSMGLIVRKVLQDARDLDEAEKIIRQSPRMCGFNYVMGCGKGPEIRVLETNAEAAATFRPNERSKDDPQWMLRVVDAMFRADTAMNPEVRDKQTCTNGKPNVSGVESPIGSGAYDSRYKVIGDLLQEKHGKVDAREGIKIMQAAAMPKSNVQSFVCNCSDMVFRVAVAKGKVSAHKRRYTRFDFQRLFEETRTARP